MPSFSLFITPKVHPNLYCYFIQCDTVSLKSYYSSTLWVEDKCIDSAQKDIDSAQKVIGHTVEDKCTDSAQKDIDSAQKVIEDKCIDSAQKDSVPVPPVPFTKY